MQPFQRDTIAALFWPELDQSRARAALRRTLTPLNKALGEEALITTRDTVALNPDYELWVDVLAFQSAAVDFQQHDHPELATCVQCLTSSQTAVSLYKGDFMAGFTLRDAPEFDDWQFFEMDRLRRLYASTLERLIPILAGKREHDPSIELAQKWLALDPLHEPAHRALMRLYAQTNQRTAALRQYRECVRILDEELGVPPLEETKQLYEEILEGKKETEQNGEGEKEYHLSSPASIHRPSSPPAPSTDHRTLTPTPQYPLTGRQTEFEGLFSAYNQVFPDGFFVGIEGEAGVGKTRLVEEFLSQVQARGTITLTARCYRGEEQLAYGPVIEGFRSVLSRPGIAERLSKVPVHWQTELSRLLPEFPFPLPLVTDSHPGTQTRLFESVRQILYAFTQGSEPAILFFDDLQWADSASLDLLMYIARRLQDYPVLIIGAWRNEGNVERLAGLMAESQRSGLGAKYELGRLNRSEVAQLTKNFEAISSDLFQVLFEETEGLPYFVVEYLTAAQQGQNWKTLRSIEDLERARLVNISETARQVMTAAAVIGRSFEFETLREASGRSEEETITGVEQLIGRGLLAERSGDVRLEITASKNRESAPLQYDFTHEKIRAVVYEDTSLARRRLLHRRVAEVLLPSVRDNGENAARIAHHYQRAGQDLDAALYYQQAGDYSRRLFANSESLSHLQTALALGHPEPSLLHEAIGDLQTLQGDYRSAVTSYETASALSTQEHLPYVEHKLANLHYRRGDDDLAASYFQSAREKLHPKTEIEAQAHILADWSRTCARQSDNAQAIQLAEEALALSKQGTDPTPAGQAHNVLGMIARQAGNFTQASAHLQQALVIAENAKNLPAQIAALNNLALVCEDERDFDRAIELAQAALDLCAKYGDRHREAALRNRLADLFHASDQPSAAMYHLKKAVEIFAEIGGEIGTYEPEVWKLTEW
ncbi:MAG: AAA family ATPase [Anaerolineae bacterium]|nr:AAA family ATPase [Anaerolineae bacterium]